MRMILFGCPDVETWIWTGTDWVQLSLAVEVWSDWEWVGFFYPAPRAGASA